MPRSIHLFGQSDGLRDVLEDRFSRAGAIIQGESIHADLSIGLSTKEKCNLAILPEDMDSENADLVITLSDVIIPNGGDNWGNGAIKEWVQKVMRDEDLESSTETRYWVNVRDIADAITTLCMRDGGLATNGRITMCGRRPWKMHDVVEEIRLLWERYNNSINHSHSAKSLSQIPSPVRGIQSDTENRPDFETLQKALLESGSQGWHPLVPMRISLMEVIASLE